MLQRLACYRGLFRLTDFAPKLGEIIQGTRAEFLIFAEQQRVTQFDPRTSAPAGTNGLQ